MGNVIETVEVRVLITELPTLVEKKSKQTDLNNTPDVITYPLMTYVKYFYILSDRYLLRYQIIKNSVGGLWCVYHSMPRVNSNMYK
jgi:hypothetical protein